MNSPFVDKNSTFFDMNSTFVDMNPTFVDKNPTFVDKNSTFFDMNLIFVDIVISRHEFDQGVSTCSRIYPENIRWQKFIIWHTQQQICLKRCQYLFTSTTLDKMINNLAKCHKNSFWVFSFGLFKNLNRWLSFLHQNFITASREEAEEDLLSTGISKVRIKFKNILV